MRLHGKGRNGSFHQICEIELGVLQLQAAAFNSGEIQNRVDEVQQRIAVGHHDV